jgi:EmrB/QacA subfamily drug resistance transporter
MSALDGSVVNTLLPVISRSFSPQSSPGLASAEVAQVEWVVTIYLLVLSGLLLSFGRLGDLRGHKMVYNTGFAIFLVSSALCGLAPSVNALIVFRAIQAIGAAMLSANSPAILTKSFPSRQRGQALGLQATMTYLGLTVGPSLGGWVSDQFSWRAVFYINVPVILIALFLSIRFIPSDKPEKQTEQFDLKGALVFMAGLVALLFALNQGHALGWTSPVILGILIGSMLLIGWFIQLELKHPFPMLDLRLFSSGLFSSSVASAVLNYICVYSIMFLMPFYLIQGQGLSTSQAGLILTSMPIVMAIVAPISGTLSDRYGTRIPTVVGMAILTLGLAWLAGLGPNSSTGQIAIRMGVCGLGIGIFISPNNSALMGSAPRNRQGIAAGILATARNVGMVLGIGLTGAIFTTGLAQHNGAANDILFSALRTSFQAAAIFAGIGILTTATRSLQPDPNH